MRHIAILLVGLVLCLSSCSLFQETLSESQPASLKSERAEAYREAKSLMHYRFRAVQGYCKYDMVRDDTEEQQDFWEEDIEFWCKIIDRLRVAGHEDADAVERDVLEKVKLSKARRSAKVLRNCILDSGELYAWWYSNLTPLRE